MYSWSIANNFVIGFYCRCLNILCQIAFSNLVNYFRPYRKNQFGIKSVGTYSRQYNKVVSYRISSKIIKQCMHLLLPMNNRVYFSFRKMTLRYVSPSRDLQISLSTYLLWINVEKSSSDTATASEFLLLKDWPLKAKSLYRSHPVRCLQ